MENEQPKIKICGLTRPEDIEMVNSLLPDYVGFVFYPKSKRYVTDAQAKELSNDIDKRIQVVGVFVDEDMDHIEKLVREGTVGLVQLHGSEDEEYIRTLRTRIGVPIIKAFVIKDGTPLTPIETSSADEVLLDAGKGSGKTFDWTNLAGLKRRFILAGGLTGVNIQTVLDHISPYAVDVSSGVEFDGTKNAMKMKDFVAAVRNERTYDEE